MSARWKRSSAPVSTSTLYSIAEQRRCVFPQHFFLDRFAVTEGTELFDVPAGGSHARRRPVCPPQDLVRNLCETRHVSRQQLRRNAGELEMHFRVAARQKERPLSVEGTSRVREDDWNTRGVHGN